MWDTILWRQFGAAIDMLEQAVRSCPDELWSDPARQPEWSDSGIVGFWYLVYHTLFWLDYYLSVSEQGFRPPHPFTLDELDPAGLLPERPYTKEELKTYLEHGRQKCRATIAALTDEKSEVVFTFPWGTVTFAELLLYNLRHVQHHTAQLNLILRQRVHAAPGWVAVTDRPLLGREEHPG
jgi:hypothetical protein